MTEMVVLAFNVQFWLLVVDVQVSCPTWHADISSATKPFDELSQKKGNVQFSEISAEDAYSWCGNSGVGSSSFGRDYNLARGPLSLFSSEWPSWT